MKLAKDMAKLVGLGDDAVQFDSSYIHWVFDDKGMADIGVNVTDNDGKTIAKTDIKISQDKIK